MKNRKPVLVFAWIVLGIALAAGVTLYTNYAVRASAPSLPDALSNLPVDCQVVFGMNVPKFVASPVYLKMREKQNWQIGSSLAEFIQNTGLDPSRDISYLVAAGRTADKTGGQGTVIAVGAFNREKITGYIRSKANPIEAQYGNATVLMVPDRRGGNVDKGIVFLDDREIAMGDLESLKAVLDVRGKGKRSILFNPALAPLINSISPDEMFWFAGDAAGLLANAPVRTPLGPNVASIRNILGTLNFGSSIVGKVTATAVDAASAAKLADVARGFIALGQLSGDKDPNLKMLLDGVAVSQSLSQVNITLNFPADLLDKLIPARPSGSGLGSGPALRMHP